MGINQKIETILQSRINNLKSDGVKLNKAETEQLYEIIKSDLKNSFEIALQKSDTFQHKLKIIFLEYDFVWGENDAERKAYLCGFGDGEGISYPLLQEPKYLGYNYKDELFNGVGNIRYDLETDEITEIIDKENGIHIVNNLKQIEIDEVYLLIHKAMKELQVEIFQNKKNMENEIYIYANLHDRECSNIFVIKKED